MRTKSDCQKMRVLIVCPYFFEPHRWMISAYKTALYLSKQCSVIVLTTGAPSFEQINPNLRVYRMKDWFMPDPINYSIVPGMIFYLLNIIHKEKPTHFIVNKHMFYTSFSIIWLKLLQKKVITVTDTFPGINWLPRNPLVRIVMQVYARTVGWFLLKISDRVILLHEGLTAIAKKYHLNYQVIHNGVDLKIVDSTYANTNEIDNHQINIIYVGRLESIKGYADILTAAKIITGQHPNVCFHFVGSIAGKEDWVKKQQTPMIKFWGHRDDAIALMKACDIFVLASYSEGLPNALMEAMTCRLACIASNVGGVKILINDGRNGLTFPPGDIRALVETIEKLIDDKDNRHKLATEARRTIETDFSWEKIAEQYETLLKISGEYNGQRQD